LSDAGLDPDDIPGCKIKPGTKQVGPKLLLGAKVLRMRRGLLFGAIVIFCFAPLAKSAQKDMTNPGSWSGIIINSGCTLDQAFAEAEACTKSVPGGPLSFYDDTTRQIFALDPQKAAVGHLGDAVTVHGTLEGDTLHLASLEMLASIGLAVGQKAPAFSALDQFGHQQSLDTLKGPKGTALLFFRSADW
jgi:hypothetical protein